MTKVLFLLAALAAAFFLPLGPFLTSAVAVIQKPADSKPKVSDAEAKALDAINGAPDAAAKLTAAEAFVKKYPKSAMLSVLAQHIAVEINKAGDSNQKLALASRFEKAFTDDKATMIIHSAKLDAYAAANQVDEAFKVAAIILEKDPEEVHTMVQMTLTGSEEAKRGNGKYLKQTQQYGVKAIELIEANRKPAAMDEASWANHKAALPQLYQQTAILAMVEMNPADAKARLTKAISLRPDDPTSHAIMAYIVNNEYVQLAGTYKAMPDGKQKEEMLPRLEGLLDNIIDEYARTVALATGKPEYQQTVQQVMPDLTNYYKYRHNQSVEGLQQLIDKYKPQPATKP